MSSPHIIEHARRLHAEGRVEEAEAILLREGYEEQLDEKAQPEYRRLFPLPSTLHEKLKAYDVRLRDAALRVKAAREISRQPLGEPTRVALAWMRNPWATEFLTSHLTNDDPLVREHMVTALAMIFLRYFKDQRAFEPLIPHLKSARPTERLWACNALALLGEKSLEHVLPMIHDRAQLVRSESMSQLGMLMHRQPLSEGAKALIRSALLAAPRDGDVQFRTAVASLLLPVALPEDAENLSAWKRKDSSKAVKGILQAVIDRLAAPDGSGSEVPIGSPSVTPS